MLPLLAIQCNLRFDKHQKNQVHFLYQLSFQLNIDKKSYIITKIETVKIYMQFSANCGTAPISSQLVESHRLFQCHWHSVA